MPELRHDPLTATHVIVAPGRATRPDTFRVAPAPNVPDDDCPFCPGHEHHTPPEVARAGTGDPGRPGWRVRVVPNLYPLVATAPPGLTGAHEVVILSPDHDRSFGALADDAAIESFTMLRDRARHHLHDGLHHAQAFVNHGRAAGSSIAHPHAQLVALPLVPPTVVALRGRAAAAPSDLLAASLTDARSRDLVVLDGDVPVWCPYASAAPFEMLLAAPDPQPRFDLASDEATAKAALALRDALARLRALLGDAPYNVVVHSGATDESSALRWHVRIIPRTGVVAGFEHGTGLLVNVVPPEVSAPALRDATP
jgi:UDPglucose--hexose-1-phosphate uridylyltransferase